MVMRRPKNLVLMRRPKKLEFREFVKIFKERYVYQGPNGLTLIAMTSNEALLLSKYLFRGIVESSDDAAHEAASLPGLGESLERFADRNIKETDLELLATDEDLRSLGAFLMRGLVAVYLTLESPHGKAYCC
jgi:hypothetical protein